MSASNNLCGPQPRWVADQAGERAPLSDITWSPGTEYFQALVLAKQNDRVFGELLRSTQGVVFFATPHRGGNGATLGEVAANACSFISGSARNELVKSLKKKSKSLAQLSADFAHQYEDYQFLSVIESRPLVTAPMNPVRTVGFLG